MRKTILLLGSALLLASAANAAPTGWYVGISAGGNWLDETEDNANFAGGPYAPTNEFIETDASLTVLANIGYRWDSFRLEFEGGYRSNDGNVRFGAIPLASTADVMQWTAMANAYVDIPLSPKWTLSAGGGIGLNSVELDSGYFLLGTSQTDTVFAGQLIAQLSYDVSPDMQLYVDYHYTMTSDPEFENIFFGLVEHNRFEITNHAVLIGLRFDLDPAS